MITLMMRSIKTSCTILIKVVLIINNDVRVHLKSNSKKYYIKIQNGIYCMHYNEVNKISECNLLNYILNPYRRTKTLNIHYSPIISGCVNTRKGRTKLNNF